MSESEQSPLNLITPQMREAMRHQIVVHRRHTSDDLVSALQLRYAVVVRMLERFEAVGAVRLVRDDERADAVSVDPHSLSARFRDLTIPLW